MIEALYKKKILFIYLFTIVISQENLNSEYIFSNIVPIELSHNSFGIRLIEHNNNLKTYFNYQTWISDNLSLDGHYSPSFKNIIDITYGINVGYSSKLDYKYFKNINYSIGYFRNKFSNNTSKWSNISIIPSIRIDDENWILFSFNYLYSKIGDNKINTKSLICRYINIYKEKFIINSGIQVHDYNHEVFLHPFVGLNYIL